MNRGEPLTELEQFVLLALLRLEDEAYGVSIRREIEETTGRSVSITAAYAALDRLEGRGYVSSWIAEATAVRGGRAKKHFKLEKAGARALNAAHDAMTSMWDGLERHPSLKTR